MVQKKSVQEKRSFNTQNSACSAPTALQNNIRVLRRKQGFTLEALSKLIGISASYLCRLEQGDRRLNTDLLRDLTFVFNCDVGDILDVSFTKKPHKRNHRGLTDKLTEQDCRASS